MAATLLRLSIDPWIGDKIPYGAFFLAILVAGRISGFASALVVTALSALSSSWFFTEPRHTLLLHSPPDLIALSFFCLIGALISRLAHDMQAGRRAAEEARNIAREGEHRLNRAQEIAHLGSWELDVPSGKLSWSDEVFRIFGFAPQEFHPSYRSFLDAVHPDDRKMVDDAYSGSLRNGSSSYEIDHRIVQNSTNEVRIVHEKCEHIRDESGRVVRSVGMVHDVTDRKRAEQALLQSQARLRLTYDNLGVGILEVEGADRFVAANDHACKILGYSREELFSLSVKDITHPDDLAISNRINAEIHDGTSDRAVYEKRYIRKDGTPVWNHITVSAVRDDKGSWIRSITSVEDITERKRAEDALIESQRSLKELFESIYDGVLVHTADGQIVDCNSRFLQLYGLRREDALHYKVADISSPSAPLETIPLKCARALDGQPQLFEWKALRPYDRTEFDVEVYLRKVLLGGRELIMANFHDITDRKQSEKVLRKAMEDLRESDRRKDEFLAMLAHELRNPMSTISAAAHLLQRCELPEKAKGAQAALDRQTKHLAKLVDDLLDISRITRGKVKLERESVDLRQRLESVLELVEPEIERAGLTLKVELPHSPLPAEGDPVRLEQIFSNLLSNAIRYTESGGHISVTARCAEEYAIIEVADTGVGIEPELQQMIFEPFMQIDAGLSRSKGGLGVGLSIVKHLTELHGGTVGMHSDGRGKGTCFTLRFPLSRPRYATARNAPTTGPKTPLHVLVVDDNRDTAVLTAALLEAEGHRTQIAFDGETGLDLAVQSVPDAILLDIGLPGLDGFEVARRVREAGLRATAIIAVSGYGQERDLLRAQQAGFDAHLLKPLQYEELWAILSRWQESNLAEQVRTLRSTLFARLSPYGCDRDTSAKRVEPPPSDKER